MNKIRFVNLDLVLQKQFSPLHTNPVVPVSHIETLPVDTRYIISCPQCGNTISANIDYNYCPYCSKNIKEVFN